MAMSFGIEVEGFIPSRKWAAIEDEWGGNQYRYVQAYLYEVGQKIREQFGQERAWPLINSFVDGYGHADFEEGQGWRVTSDGSVVNDLGRRVGTFEIVSPVLKGREALNQVSDLLRAINAMGGRVNNSCGQHVHFGVMDKSWFSWNKFGAFANRVNGFYEHFIEVFLGIQPRSRGRDCIWVQRHSHDERGPSGSYGTYTLNLHNEENLRGIVNRKEFLDGAYRDRDRIPESSIRAETGGRTDEDWRYKCVNWTTSMWRNGTVEFRQGMATLSPLHTIQWIRLLHKVYVLGYAPEWREGGRYHDMVGDWTSREPTVDQMMDYIRASASMHRYWAARFDWYNMSFAERRAWSVREGGISERNNTSAQIVSKGRRQWFIKRNANNY